MASPPPHPADSSSDAHPPEVVVLLAATAGDVQALVMVTQSYRDLVASIESEGQASWGSLPLDARKCARGLARVLAASWEAERAASGRALAVERLAERVVARDLYLAEALVNEAPQAWICFQEVVDQAFRSVHRHFTGKGHQHLGHELRESVLGSFFLENKVASFRATAPIGAWARQVIFNLFLQAVNQAAREGPSLSQVGSEEGDGASLVPGSAAAPPELLARAEWDDALREILPEVLTQLAPEERRMLEVLPTRRMTQIQLSDELGVSPFRMSRWYKDLRARFLRDLASRLRWRLGLEDEEVAALMTYVGRLAGAGPQDRDLSQSQSPSPSLEWRETARSPQPRPPE